MIYFDNAATTCPDKQCLEAATKYLTDKFYNPSALYAEGYSLHLDILKAKHSIMSHIASEEYELIATSCGTEADNQAIFCGGRRGNIVTTYGEHAAVFASAQELARNGADVRFAALNSDGSVNVQNLLSLIDKDTSLVSVIHVNNETGAINDINAIAAKVKALNPRTLFHADGVQAFGKIKYKLGNCIDMYSISAHKIGALKGTGALIKRKKLVLKPFIFGGGQENGLRSGTENVFGIKMFEFAAQKTYSALTENFEKISAVKQTLISMLDKQLFKVISSENSSPYILTVAAEGVRGETILHMAEDCGLIIGTGSACSSNAAKRYSRVITACGYSGGIADGILRLSFCKNNTLEEAEQAAQILNKIVGDCKEMLK